MGENTSTTVKPVVFYQGVLLEAQWGSPSKRTPNYNLLSELKEGMTNLPRLVANPQASKFPITSSGFRREFAEALELRRYLVAIAGIARHALASGESERAAALRMIAEEIPRRLGS